ncbi:adenylyltransferase SelO-like protein [Drosera capensis]
MQSLLPRHTLLSSSFATLRPNSLLFLFPSRLRPFPRRTLPFTMGSTSTAASLEGIADGLRNQSLNCVDDEGDRGIGGDVRRNNRLSLEELTWDHSFVRELPGDRRTDSIPRQVYHACYSKVAPSVEVDDPKLVAWSESVAEILDLDPKEFERPDFPLLFSGASLLVGSLPYAQCYGGHQFGMWAGQLGDGRAITLGEVINSKSERWELQVKGAGKTPYSRFADGLAVLRSSIREFLCSEAMHSLGIPTTRALCLMTTGKYVVRDMFYDGNPKEEPGAIVCRVAPSFLRFGSYQLHASRGKEDHPIVRALADYAIRHHFPHIEKMTKSEDLSFSTGESDQSIDLTSNKYAAWAVEVAERTASLVARWQGVGFTHGVLNTDNMSILGLTIDYGPFGFLDAFDPSYTPNTTDLPGRRYCFANQPDIGLWNIARFSATLQAAGLLDEKEAEFAMERYGTKFMDEYQAIVTRKLGLAKYNKELISKLLSNLAVDKVDYTNFFRLLSNIKADPSIPESELLVPLKAVLLDMGKERKEAWIGWLKSYIQELTDSGISDEERKASMNSVNPKYILRNYLCQSAIDAAEQGDFEEVRRLLKVMERPYDVQPGMEKYARLPPAWAYRPGVCMLSCSS